MVQVIARMLGWKPRPQWATPARPLSRADIEALAGNAGVALTRGGDLGMPAPILDLAALREKNQRRAVDIAKGNMAALPNGSPAADAA